MFQVEPIPHESIEWYSWRLVDYILATPWYGTALGALMLWGSGEETQLVYRGFLPDDLIGVLDEDRALDLTVDAVLGAVNAVGVFEHLVDATAGTDDLDDQRQHFNARHGWIRGRYRGAGLRAATRPRARRDGLTDMSGPLVDIGAAMIDRLVDQMQIATAPFDATDRGFVWLPGPYAQHVEAGPMRPSRGHEIADIVVSTHLGSVPPDQCDDAAHACTALMATLPMCSLVLGGEGDLRLSTVVMVHEGVWWHRADLLAITAAIQLNCAEIVRAALGLAGVHPDPSTPLRDRLARSEDVEYDSIYDIAAWARSTDPTRCPPVRDLISLVTSRLHDLPDSRLFGDLDEEPDVVMAVKGLDDDGGWDPGLGEVMVMLDEVDHEVAGEALRVRLHPGFPPGGPDMAGEAIRLTRFSHSTGGGAVAPSWSEVSGSIGPTIVIPRICISSSSLDNGTEIVLQSVYSCLYALANACISDPNTFAGYDRSQVNLTRADPQDPYFPWAPETVVWAPWPNARGVAVRMSEGDIESWADMYFSHEASDALIDWLNAKDNTLLFQHNGTQVTGYSAADNHTLVKGGHTLELDSTAASSLCAQLAHPEGPAVGRASGRIVTYPIDFSLDDDGDPVILIPSAHALTTVMGGADLECAGISVITTTSLWVCMWSQAGTLYIDLVDYFVDTMVKHSATRRHDRADSRVPRRGPAGRPPAARPSRRVP